MVRTIKGTEHFSKDQKDRILHKVNDIIVETFIDPADVDYVTARFQYLGGSSQGVLLVCIAGD